MKIDYKITTFTLIAILLITLFWSISSQMSYSKSGNMRGMNNQMSMGNVHRMPNGQMMNSGGYMDMMDMTMNDMLMMMKGKKGKDLEEEFIRGMIPHHQGAVDMAKLLLEDTSISRDVADFAKAIITAQEGEIKMMNEWLKKY